MRIRATPNFFMVSSLAPLAQAATATRIQQRTFRTLSLAVASPWPPGTAHGARHVAFLTPVALAVFALLPRQAALLSPHSLPAALASPR
jgi:hypothetical protein